MRHRIRTLLTIMLGGCLFVPAVTMPLLEVTVYIRPTQLVALFFPEEHPKESMQPSRLRPFFKSLLQGLTTASSAGTDGRAPKSAPLLRGSRTEILTPEGTLEVWHKQRSIVGIELCRQKHFFVAFAIVVFSILVPIVKMALLTYYAVSPRYVPVATEKWLHLLHKHQQVEPLIAATLVAFLSVNAAEHPSGAFYLSSSLKSGFYLYVAYFLASIYANETVTFRGS